MTRVRFVDRLQGDAIIVRADAPLRTRAVAMLPGRSGAARRGEPSKARELLRGLAVIYKTAKKK